MRIVILLLLLSPISWLQAAPVWVSVKHSIVRDQPSFLASNLAKVNYLDELQRVKQQDPWWQVKVNGKTGWMHRSALSEEPLEAGKKKEKPTLVKALSFFGKVQTNDDSDGGSGLSFGQMKDMTSTDDTDEVTLAGKGFNKEVEALYRQQEDALDYDSVDRLEAMIIETGELEMFAQDGQLNSQQLVTSKTAPASDADDMFGDY